MSRPVRCSELTPPADTLEGMSAIRPGMIDHLSLQVTDVARSRAFYETLLAPLGLRAAYTDEEAVGFADEEGAPLWIVPAGRVANRELHFAFAAANRPVVRQFGEAALGLDAEILHEPRLFPEYGPNYFGCFVRDPDGHNVETVCRSAA
jgi:catechol 2,3-dioxygenase-like lactoylglutathione lyase family enzyme